MAALSKLEEAKISRSQAKREPQAALPGGDSDAKSTPGLANWASVPADSLPPNFPADSIPTSFPANSLPTSLPVLLSLVGVLAVVSTVVSMPLGFDGSYYLLKLLDESAPYVPHNRLGNILLQLPALLASNIGDRLTPAVMAFSFTYSVLPLACMLACYLMVRKHNPSLMMWPAISMALVSVVLGPVRISENLIASELAWLLVLGIITPPNRTKSVALCLTALFMATLHPCSVLYIGLAAYVSFRGGSNGFTTTDSRKVSATLALAFFAIAAARCLCAFLFPAPYESDTLSFESLFNYGFRILFSPLMYVELYAIACGVLFLKGKNIALNSSFVGGEKIAAVRRFKAAMIAMLIGLTIGALWSMEITMLDHSFFAGRFIVIPSLVLMICAVLDNQRRSAQTASGAEVISKYRVLIISLAFVGILCLGLAQCTTWLNVKRWVQYETRHHKEVVIDIDAQDYKFGAPLAHWSAGSLAILLQGQNPGKVLLKAEAVQAAREKGIYTINAIEPPLAQKWFHLPAGESARRTQ